MSHPELSIVVPVYNEEDSVGPLHQAVVAALEPEGLDFELVLVDDGSKDSTFANAAAVVEQDPRVRVVKLRRNSGQTQAMVTGIDHARGRVVVTMDGDLQNDPADIPLFLAKIREGYDLVVGWRHKRQDPFWSRRFPSIIANWLIGKVTGVPIKDNGCSLKAYRAELIRRTPLYSEMHRFIPAMMSIHGVRIAELKVRHHARRFGSSKYGLSRVYKVCLDLVTIKTVTTFARRPMQAFATAATAPALLAMVAALAGLQPGVPGLMPLTVALLLALLALFLLGLGVLGHLAFRSAPDALAGRGADPTPVPAPLSSPAADPVSWPEPSFQP